MYTQINHDDYVYNREFQRMRYLNEEVSGNDPFTKTGDQQLIDLGWKVESFGNNVVQKKSPHFKYF